MVKTRDKKRCLAYSPEVRHITRPIWLRCTQLSLSYGYWLSGCPKDWKEYDHSCYYVTGETSSKLNDARAKCETMSATLPIIKSDSANNFILKVGRVWVWLGMKRKNGRMVWFDNTPVDEALYSAWNEGEPSKGENDDCAFLDFHTRKWNDEKCEHRDGGPYVLCQKMP